MKTVSLQSEDQNDEAFELARRSIEDGHLVAVPADDTYVLVGDATHTGAADRLFAATRRSRTYELSVLVSDVDQAHSLSLELPSSARAAMAKLWPGPLTLVLPRNPEFEADLGSDDETIGVRCPGHSVTRRLCDAIGPLATTAAGLHGQAPFVSASEIESGFGNAVSLIIDAGELRGGAATVVDMTGADYKLIRQGVVSRQDLEAVLLL